jgi:hypothetical protein
MKSLFGQIFGNDTFEKWLKLLALGSFAVGLALLLFPERSLQLLAITGVSGALFFQSIGLLSIAFGIGYLIASLDPIRHYSVVAVGAILRLFFLLLLIKGAVVGEVGLQGLLYLGLYLAFGLIVFIYILVNAYDQNTKEESAPKQFHHLINYVRTNQGQTLSELSEKQNVLLIFIRHFGCTFCRETVSEIAKLDSGIRGKNLTPVFVHMSDPAFADEFFSRYYDHPVQHISDPARVLFRSFGLKRGSLNQLFGLKVVVRGFWAGFFKGHGIGAFEGDFLQLGGYFVLSKGQVVFEHMTRGAADTFVIELLPQR